MAASVMVRSGGCCPAQAMMTWLPWIFWVCSHRSRRSQNVPVDCTAVRNVKKPAGAKPGMVIYDHYSTVYVTPDPALPEQLKP